MSITSPLLKKLKGHILALTRPPEARPNYALPITSPAAIAPTSPPNNNPRPVPGPLAGSQGSPDSLGNRFSRSLVGDTATFSTAADFGQVGAAIFFQEQLHERGTFLGGIGPPQNSQRADGNSQRGTKVCSPASDRKASDTPRLAHPGMFVCSSTPTSTPLIPYGKSKHQEFIASDEDNRCNPADAIGSSLLDVESTSLEPSQAGLPNTVTSSDLSFQFDRLMSSSDLSGDADSHGQHNFSHISSSGEDLSPDGANEHPGTNVPNPPPRKGSIRSSPATQSSPTMQSSPTTQSSPCPRRAVFPRVKDSHPSLQPLCSTLEEILLDGLQGGQHTPFGYTKYTYWDWMKDLMDKNGAEYREQVVRVATCKGVRGGLGRGRQLLRQLLAHGCLQVPLLCQVKHRDLTTARYSPNAVLAHEILSEIFLSLVRQVDLIKFDLDLDNCHFLEESWELPLCRKATLNTRLDLGLHLAHAQGRCLVLRMDGGGAAHKAGSVHTGDVITAINGADMRGCGKARVAALLRQAADEALPLRLTLVEGIESHGRVYPPLLPLLAVVGADAEDLAERRSNEEGCCVPPPSAPATARFSSGVEGGAGGRIGDTRVRGEA